METLQYSNGHILTGGYYTTINNSSANPYMTSLNPATGKDDGFIHLGISGNYQFPGVSSNPTRVYNQQLSHDGTLDLVEGDFTSVGGQPRQQIFMLDVSGPSRDGHRVDLARVRRELQLQRVVLRPVRGLVAGRLHRSTSRRPGTSRMARRPGAVPGPGRVTRRSPTRPPRPASRTRGSTTRAATRSTPPRPTRRTAYFAGHERWSSNPNGCDFAGPGAIAAPGIEGLSPAQRRADLQPHPGTRARCRRHAGHQRRPVDRQR